MAKKPLIRIERQDSTQRNGKPGKPQPKSQPPLPKSAPISRRPIRQPGR